MSRQQTRVVDGQTLPRPVVVKDRSLYTDLCVARVCGHITKRGRRYCGNCTPHASSIYVLTQATEGEWRVIAGHENYLVSSTGLVFSLASERVLTGFVSRPGYRMVKLGNTNRGGPRFCVHRLVAAAFIDNPERKPQVNHKDGVKLNNRVENLEWATGSENMRHAWATGLQPMTDCMRESANKNIRKSHLSQHKLSLTQAEEIRARIVNGEKQYKLADEFHVSAKTIGQIKKGRTYRHGLSFIEFTVITSPRQEIA